MPPKALGGRYVSNHPRMSLSSPWRRLRYQACAPRERHRERRAAIDPCPLQLAIYPALFFRHRWQGGAPAAAIAYLRRVRAQHLTVLRAFGLFPVAFDALGDGAAITLRTR